MKVIFYIAKSGDWLDKFVGLWTRGKYSHCELVFSDGMCFSSSPRDGGTRFKAIEINPKHWDIVEVSTDKEVEIRQWCESQCGLKYDWLGILGLAIHLPIENRKKWYCSEICITVLNLFGVLDCCRLMNPSRFYSYLRG
jgi:hypothetical protein